MSDSREFRVRITVAVGVFGLEDAGGAGSHDDGDAVGAVTLLGFRHRHHEPILLEAQPCESVVPAVKPLQPVLKSKVFKSIDPPDICFQ